MKLLKAKKDWFLFFLILVFVFISSSALALTGQPPFIYEFINEPTPRPEKFFPPVPVLKDSASFPIVSAQGALAVDLESGVSLYDKNSEGILLPASTTKIITALVALDYYPLNAILTIPRGNGVEGQKMGLPEGTQMEVEDLLYGMLVYSANDAAKALAKNYPGGEAAFVEAMNTKAKELSMKGTNFDNPVGLDGISQRSTAKDLVRASEVAMRDPEFAKIVGTKQIFLTDVSGKLKFDLKNINELLGSVPGVLGVKTGWTENARENLVTYIERDNKKIMIAVLGSQDRFGETRELIDWIFENYKWEEVAPPIVRNNPK
jgi:D-alanyl-D-alanine carboxypeptidase